MMQQESTVYDLAYRGKTAAVKILLNENEKLKTQTDNVRIVQHCAVSSAFLRLYYHFSFPEWSNVDTLGGLGWSRRPGQTFIVPRRTRGSCG